MFLLSIIINRNSDISFQYFNYYEKKDRKCIIIYKEHSRINDTIYQQKLSIFNKNIKINLMLCILKINLSWYLKNKLWS